MPLVYAAVARTDDNTVLAHHAVAGSPAAHKQAALDLLARARRGGGDQRFSLSGGGAAYHFLQTGGYTFAVASTDDAAAVPLACAKRISDAWSERHWEGGRGAGPLAMDRSFGCGAL